MSDLIVGYCGYKFLTDVHMSKRMADGVYEKQEISLIDKIRCIEDMKILELGACLGVVSVIVNKKLRDPNNHVVVEANPKLIRYLEHNKKLNDCQFAIEHCMISLRSDGTFYSYDRLVAGSAHRTDNYEANKTKHIVKVLSLQEIMDKHQMEFDVIIMDIEGGELEFIKDNLGGVDVKYLMVELHERQMHRGFDKQCIDLIESKGMVRVAKNNVSFLYRRDILLI